MDRSLKFLHLNVNRRSAVTDQLGDIMLSRSIDVASLNEQRVHEGKIVGTPDGYSEVKFPDKSRAAFWVNSRLKYCVITNTRNIVAIRCTISEEDVLIVSCYCSPSEDIDPILTQLGDLLDEYPYDNIQVVGDFNPFRRVVGAVVVRFSHQARILLENALGTTFGPPLHCRLLLRTFNAPRPSADLDTH